MAASSEDKCVIYQPPFPCESGVTSIFLAGSIEMGTAINWQKDFTTFLSDLPVNIFNPRRKDFDPTWKQDISNPLFKEQVDWELNHLAKADVIALFFQADTKSPISLVELGLFAKEGKLVVCCPEGFWRRGNVQIICEKYKVPLVDTEEELKNRLIAARIHTLFKLANAYTHMLVHTFA
jgi:hypothetical protein